MTYTGKHSSKNSSKSILILSHFFPPYSNVGGKRAYYFARYLSKKGYKVSVIKASNDAYGENVEKENTFKDIYKGLKIFELPCANFSRFKYIAWFQITSVYKHLIEDLLKSEHFDVMYLSGDPFYYFPLGNYFKHKFGISYILDYRDCIYGRVDKSLAEFFYNLIFKYVWDKPSIKDASFILHVTDSMRKAHQENNPSIDKNKFVTIYNGFDDLTLANFPLSKSTKKPKSGVLKAGIFGSFERHTKSHVPMLCEAIHTLKEQYSINLNVVRVGSIETTWVENLDKWNIQQSVVQKGPLPYLDGMKVMSCMDFFILNNSEKYALGTKIFDYIFLDKPIIAFVFKQSEVAAFLKKNCKNGFVATSVEEFVNIVRFINKNNLHTLSPTRNKMFYSRSMQAEKLIELINKC